MSNIIYEIIVCVIILTLLLGVISMYRDSLDVIQLAAQRVNDTDKVKQEILVPLNRSEVYGSDVIAVIRYYSTKSGVQIRVTKKTGSTLSKLYQQGETYDPNSFAIPYERIFLAAYTRSGQQNIITGITYTEK